MSSPQVDLFSSVGILVVAAAGIGGLLIGLAVASQSETPPPPTRY